MKISTILFPIILFGVVFGFGLKTDSRNIPNHINSQSVFFDISSIPIIEIIPWETVSSMIGQVNQARVMTDLRKLTGAEQVCLDHGCYTITNRVTGSTGLQWAKDYIEEELIKVGYSVVRQNWSDDQNLIVNIMGSSGQNEVICFLAHIDGVANSSAADDNASGVVSLMELARILSSRSFRTSIVLIFSTGEEQGVLGIQSYVDLLTPQEVNSIKSVINVDMIGYDANNDKLMELFNGSQPVEFVQSLAEIITAYHIGLLPQIYSDCG